MEQTNKVYCAKSLRTSSKSGSCRQSLSCIRSGHRVAAVLVALVPFICVFFLLNRFAIGADNSEGPLAAGSAVALDAPVYDSYDDTRADTLEELDQLLEISVEHIKAHRYNEAVSVLADMLNKDPDKMMRAVIYYNRGLCNYYLEDYSTAVEDLELSVESSPFAEAYYCLGLAYVALDLNAESVQKAIEAYSSAIDQKPEDVNYLLVRASAYEALGQNSNAYEDYCAAYQLAPTNVDACAGVERLEPVK